jgi:signal transduction histidine kinase
MKGESAGLVVLDDQGEVVLSQGAVRGLLACQPPEKLERHSSTLRSLSSSVESRPHPGGTTVLLATTGATESSRRRRHAIHRSLGHELRGALHTTSLHLALMREALLESAGVAERDDRLRRSVDALARQQADLQRVLETLLEFARPPGGGIVSFDLREACREALRLSRSCPGDDIELLFDEPDTPVTVVDDRDAVRQSILEALLYALGVPDSRVRLRLESDPRRVRCIVETRRIEATDGSRTERVMRSGWLSWPVASATQVS